MCMECDGILTLDDACSSCSGFALNYPIYVYDSNDCLACNHNSSFTEWSVTEETGKFKCIQKLKESDDDVLL